MENDNAEVNTSEETGDASDLTTWVSNNKYVPRNLIAIVVRNFDCEDEKDDTRAKTLKVLMEQRALSIKGFHTHFSLTEQGGRFKITPVLRFQEAYGRPVDHFFTHWYTEYLTDVQDNIRKFYSDPVSPAIRRKATVDVLFIEPDPTHTKVVMAWSATSMYPNRYFGIESQRDLARTPEEHVVVEAHFQCDIETGEEVIQLAQKELEKINIQSANPHERGRILDVFVTQ